MKSLRANLAYSIILVSIMIIMMMSFSIVGGFFSLSESWNKAVTDDITAYLNNEFFSKYNDVEDLNELNDIDLQNIVDKTMNTYEGRLRGVKFISNDGDFLYECDITDPWDKSLQIYKPELLKAVADIRARVFNFKQEYSGLLLNRKNTKIGKVEIASVPLMGYKYTVLFDSILTKSLLFGITAAVIISIVVSFFLSKKLSRQLKTFAAQLTMMADGARRIKFTKCTTTELQSSITAAETLQRELRQNEDIQQKRLQDIVHDLKTPVSALGIQFEAIQGGILEFNKERIDQLSVELKRIQEMIAELSQYTKLTSEDYIPAPVLFDAATLLKEVIENFNIQALNNNQKLSLIISESSCFIESDRLGLLRVVNNLIINAINNAPPGSEIWISVSRRKNIITGKVMLNIEIENDGKIDETDLPFIFDRLYRSKKSGYSGNGLGLAISKAIIEKNKGKISAVNTAFGGVIFRIELPISIDE